MSLHLLFIACGAHAALTRQPLYQRLRREDEARWRAAATAGRAQRTGAPGGLRQPLLSPDGAEAGEEEDPQQKQAAEFAAVGGASPFPSALQPPPPPPAPPPPPSPSLGSSPRAAWAAALGASWSPMPPQLVPATPTAAASSAAAAPPAATVGWTQQAALLLQVVLPAMVAAAEYCAAALLSAPAAAGIAMAAFSMLQVSVVGCLTLVLAVWSLLAPSRGRGAALRQASPALAAFYCVWLLDAYASAALCELVSVPAAVVSAGVWGFQGVTPPATAVPLLLQLLTTVAVAGLCRAETLARRGGGGGGGATEAAGGEASGALSEAAGGAEGSEFPPIARAASGRASELLQLLQFRASSDGGGAGPGGEGRGGEEEDGVQRVWESVGTGLVQVRFAGCCEVHAGLVSLLHADDESSRAMRRVLTGPLSFSHPFSPRQVTWHIGRLAVPLSCAALAASRPDFLHATYLVAMLAYFLPIPPRLTPSPPEVPAPAALLLHAAGDPLRSDMRPLSALPAVVLVRHVVVRVYGTLHLLVVYAAVVMQLPGLQSDGTERILRLVGLCDPKLLSDLGPILLVLIGATVHVALGSWLASLPPAGVLAGTARPQRAAGGSISMRPLPGIGEGPGGASQSDIQQAAPAGLTGGDAEEGGDCKTQRWLRAVHPRVLYQLIAGCSSVALTAGSYILVLLVGTRFRVVL